jgi:hypothetical protein
MLVIILLIVLLALILYKSYVPKNNNQLNEYKYEINESTFNPNYKISKDKNGLEIVDC